MPALKAKGMPLATKLSMAKERTQRVVDHTRDLLLMHEANAIIVYSPALSNQIPTSFAAIAFNQFQRNMHWLEIVRLCALWDNHDRDKENIPTIIELVEDTSVCTALVEETRAHWINQPLPRDVTEPADPEVRAAVDRALLRSQESWADEQAKKCGIALSDAIARAKSVMDSSRQIAVMNLRHKHIAHSLTETEFERKGVAQPMKYGDERWLLEETVAIVDGLHLAINSSAFMWEDAREQAKRHASSLWHNCSFRIAS
jgi:hypothetical protein